MHNRFCKLVYKIITVAHESVVAFVEDNGGLVAAAVSYYVFMSLIPLGLIAIAVGTYFLGSVQNAQQVVMDYVSDYSPVISDEVGSVIAGRGTITGISLVILLWTGISAIAALERSINVAWRVRVKRNLFMSRVVSISLLLIMGILLGCSVFLTALLKTVKLANIKLFGIAPGHWPWIWTFISYVTPLLVAIAAFIIIYKILPYTRVPNRAAVFGGIFAGVCWELAKQGFSIYVSRFADYSKIYGSLGGIILLLVWIYFSSVVVILGAEVGSTISKRHTPRDEFKVLVDI